MAALEGLGQATILLGTTEFGRKTRRDLQTMGFPADHYFCIPHNYIHLTDEHVNELLNQLAQELGDNLLDDRLISLTQHPEDVLVMVAGGSGAGAHNLCIPSFGNTRAVTVAVP